jgi:hypothetical protein
MTTITQPREQQKQHTRILGKTLFVCILKNCDGTHHVYCGCGWRNVA